MTSFVGTAGDDNFTGTASGDSFDLTQGGNDTAKGGNYYDSFYLGATLTAADKINGGAGYDYIYLNGDYSAGLVLGANTLTNIENWNFTAGNSYNITVHDNSNQGLYTASIWGGSLGATDVLTFNAAAETSSGYYITGGAADDVITGGGGTDSFSMQYGGHDTVNLGGGNDQFYGYDNMSAGDHLDGGDGSDTLSLSGDYSGGLDFGANSIQHIESLSLWSSGTNSYDIKFDDSNLDAGSGMNIYGGGLTASEVMIIDGSAETDASFQMYGGAAKDRLTGGKGDDLIYAGAGNDKVGGGGGDDFLRGDAGRDSLSGGGGGDIFSFVDGDSSIGNPDMITDLSNSDDLIDLSSIDADTTVDFDQAFSIASSFTGHAGQLVRSYDAGSNVTSFLMDTNGDGVADISIEAKGNHATFNDFFL